MLMYVAVSTFTVPPEVSVSPVNYVVLAGSNITFTCIANGNPRPSRVEWRSNGMVWYTPVLPVNDTAVMSILQRFNVQPHSAAGEYYCLSFNSVGYSEKNATLTVYGS